MCINNPVCSHSSGEPHVGQGRQEKALQTDVFRTADFCFGEDFRANQIPGGTRESQTGVQFGDDREPSQGKYHTLSADSLHLLMTVHVICMLLLFRLKYRMLIHMSFKNPHSLHRKEKKVELFFFFILLF